MSTTLDLPSALLGAAIGITGLLVHDLRCRMARTEAELLLADATTAPASSKPAPAAAWHAVPGGRIELGDTGWAVLLVPAIGIPPYRLMSPELVLVAMGDRLGELKQYAERMAADRAEFQPPPEAAAAEALQALRTAQRTL